MYTNFILRDKEGNIVEFGDNKAENFQKILDYLAQSNYGIEDPIVFATELVEKDIETIKLTLNSLRETIVAEEAIDSDLENILNKLNDLGYTIDSAKKFDAMLSHGDLEQKLAELTKLKEEAEQQQKQNEEKQKNLFIDFVKDVNLDELEDIVKSDSKYRDSEDYFKYNPGNKEFLDSIEEFKKTFGIVEEYYSDQRHLEEYQEQLQDINNRINSLDSKNELSPMEKTSTAVKLSFAKKQIKKEIEKYEKLVEEKKEAIKSFDLVDLRNKILNRINDLNDKYYKALSVDTDIMNKTAKKIESIRDRFVLFAASIMMYNDKTKAYEELCKKYGIKDISKENKKNDSKIDEMVESIRSNIEDSFTNTSDNTQNSEQTEQTPEETQSNLEPVSTPSTLTPQPDAPKNTKPSRLGGKTKFRVKNIRKAIIEPYGKAILLGAGVGSIVLALGGVGVNFAYPIIGAGLGVATVALYNHIKRGSNETIPEFENGEFETMDPIEQTSMFGKLKNLLVKVRKNKSLAQRQTTEQHENIEENTLKDPETPTEMIEELQKKQSVDSLDAARLPEVNMSSITSLDQFRHSLDSLVDNLSETNGMGR